jgi:hypothetical protein
MLSDVARIMNGYPKPWWIAGGWAIDLFVGHVRRPHSDIDIAVLREDQRELRQHLAGWSLTKVVSGTVEEWPRDEYLVLPTHEVHARRANHHAEFLLNESRGERWVFRRNAAVTLPIVQLTASPNAPLPSLCPEVVLLYKAKSPTPTDRDDFLAAAPLLSTEAKCWLRNALDRCHPGHEWRAALLQ